MSRKSSENSRKTKEDTKVTQICKLKSKADYTITILENGQIKFIPPYGEVTIDKNSFVIQYDEDAKFLTFIK